VNEAVMVLNAGSTSLKFAAYSANGQSALTLIRHGQIEEMETDPRFIAKDAGGKTLSVKEWEKGRQIDYRDAFHFVVTWLEKNMAGVKVVGAGHRVVLGGTRFDKPVLIDADVLAYLDSIVVMEPSHQPYNVSGVRALAEAFPDLAQVACFDTSFHRTMPEVAQIYALPKDVAALGIPRHLVRLHQPAGAQVRAESAARDRGASRRGNQHVRHAGWEERRDDDGFRRTLRTADGNAVWRRTAGLALLFPAHQEVR
jgi:acetate kinase